MSLPKGTKGPVSMDTDDVVALSEALTVDAQRFTSDANKILAKFDVTPGRRPYGQDPAITSAGHAMNRHDDAVKAARKLVAEITAGYVSISRATKAVVTEFKNQDGVNSASVDDVRKSMNLPEPPSRSGTVRAV